jgi:phosphatidylserine/phosphatidylglycerophosphate/cardiolipin synthase-like enzyme
LPPPEELPNISLQVINFHRPLLGTFHQKALVVDRKVALLNSNNIQDRPNIEVSGLTEQKGSITISQLTQ